MSISKNKLLHIIFIFITLASLTIVISCSSEEEIVVPKEENEQTVIMFFPWSSNLLPYFQQNIKDFSKSIEERGSQNARVMVCLATTPNTADLMELKYDNGSCIVENIRTYDNQRFTSQEGISNILKAIKEYAPGKKYGLIIGCHGMGWLPVIHTKSNETQEIFHYNVSNGPMTRYFGGLTQEYQIETSVLAQAILESGITMEYILFDDCYMSSIEVAYDLKDVTKYLIASPTEVMAYGFPYHECGKYLIGNVDYKGVIQAFYEFYSQYTYPYGTAAVTNCQELEQLANIVKRINVENQNNNISANSIQVMDGYTPAIFFDFEDYINKICNDIVLLDEFSNQLRKTILFKCHTPQYYSAFKGILPINHYSGITTSDPSSNRLSNPKIYTRWYNATH